jgi:hypothetical protein
MEPNQVQKYVTFDSNLLTAKDIEAAGHEVESIKFYNCQAEGEEWKLIIKTLFQKKHLADLVFIQCTDHPTQMQMYTAMNSSHN